MQLRQCEINSYVKDGRFGRLLLELTLAPTLQLPVLPVLPLTTPVNLASNNSCLLGSRL